MVCKALVLAAMLLPVTGQTQTQECTLPASPSIPDGRSAQRQEMMEAMTAVKAYMQKNIAFRTCLENRKAILGVELTPEYEAALISTMNESVEMGHLVADTFNAQLKVYKATH